MAARRARENRTRYVVLGILSLAPNTGYGIRQVIAKSVGHFWQESYGQLYPALRALVDEGLVRERSEAARGGHGAVYEVTPAGRAALAAWLERPPALSPPRNELLLKIFFGGAVGPEVTRRTLAAAGAAVKAELAKLEALAAQWDAVAARVGGGAGAAAAAEHPDAPYWRLTLDFGLGVMRFAARWAEEAQRVVAAAPRPRQRRRAGGARERGAAR